MLGYEVQGMDPGIAVKMKALAPNAIAGSTEAKTAFANATKGLDFDGSDGTSDSFAGKKLALNEGGRANYLKAKLRVAGVPESDINNITGGHFTNTVKAWSTGQPELAKATMAQKTDAWRQAHDVDGSSKLAAKTTATAGKVVGNTEVTTAKTAMVAKTQATNPFTGQ